ncbi:MAG: heme-binding protein [Pseudomonadota bacterium]
MPNFLSRAIALGCLVILSACSVFGSAAAPEPDYAVVRDTAPYQVRDYPVLAVVATPMDDGQSAAFGRLFDYISGDNKGETKIAMTAPVLQSTEAGTEIAMTAPVLQSFGTDGTREMVFVLTKDFTAETAPIPSDPKVRIAEIPARRVATIQFSGFFRDAAITENTQLLQAWMADQGLSPIGPPESAGYNPPWTLPPFRRNEVLIPIAAEAG